jgi:hypothetical protein
MVAIVHALHIHSQRDERLLRHAPPEKKHIRKRPFLTLPPFSQCSGIGAVTVYALVLALQFTLHGALGGVP